MTTSCQGGQLILFALMHSWGVAAPFLYKIFSAPQFSGIECTLWPLLYHATTMCENTIMDQGNWASGKEAYMQKVLSPTVNHSLNFDLLQNQYDRWLFKTITSVVNSSLASGCSPNVGLQQKFFSATYWQ